VQDRGAVSAIKQVQALYDYTAQAEGDLDFKAGDIINVLDDSDPSGWWRGELNGREGVFPSNYVQPL
jgi:amphiphysin